MEQALQQVRVQLRQQIEGHHNIHIQRYKEDLPDGTMQFPPHTIVAGLPFLRVCSNRFWKFLVATKYGDI